MSEAFKRMEVHDVFSPDRIVTFERPTEKDDTIVISQNFPGDFHLKAATLKVVAEVMFSNE